MLDVSCLDTSCCCLRLATVLFLAPEGGVVVGPSGTSTTTAGALQWPSVRCNANRWRVIRNPPSFLFCSLKKCPQKSVTKSVKKSDLPYVATSKVARYSEPSPISVSLHKKLSPNYEWNIIWQFGFSVSIFYLTRFDAEWRKTRRRYDLTKVCDAWIHGLVLDFQLDLTTCCVNVQPLLTLACLQPSLSLRVWEVHGMSYQYSIYPTH